MCVVINRVQHLQSINTKTNCIVVGIITSASVLKQIINELDHVKMKKLRFKMASMKMKVQMKGMYPNRQTETPFKNSLDQTAVHPGRFNIFRFVIGQTGRHNEAAWLRLGPSTLPEVLTFFIV